MHDTLPFDAYTIGASDADLFAPAEHIRGVGPRLSTVATALSSAGLPRSISNVRSYLAGWSERARFLIAAAAVGAVNYSTGEVVNG